MNATEPVWLEPLQKLLADVRSPQPGKEGLQKMMASLAEMESLLAHNRSDMPPQLVHFLDRRSYEKAAQYCTGQLELPRGTCGARA